MENISRSNHTLIIVMELSNFLFLNKILAFHGFINIYKACNMYQGITQYKAPEIKAVILE